MFLLKYLIFYNMPTPHFKPKSIPKSEFWNKKQKPKRKKTNKNNNWKKKLIIIFLLLILTGTLSIFLVFAWFSRDLPNPDQLIDREIAQTTTIYDRKGEHVLYELHGEEKRTLMELENIPEYVRQATIAIEDKNFYRHHGFSVWAIFRTIVTNLLKREKAGGSTLTQQFVKNAILGPEKKYSRKIKELVLAQRIEKRFTKDEILQMYLNEIPYGSNAYGVAAASQKYFNKNVENINLAEAALLAALPQAPSLYSPYGPNKELLLGRKNYILRIMHEQGYISEQEKNAAQSYEIIFTGPETNIEAPHFVMYVRSLLSQKYGEKTIEQGGLKIYTTIDWDLQKKAETIIKEKIDEYGDKYQASNASLVSLDPKTGQILAMVGSYNFFNDDIDGQVNVALSNRQPGSSLKPLIYASLFELGYTPNTILYDVETNFSTNPSEPYIPRNYDNQERGPIDIRTALASSLNIPAVKAIYLADIKKVLDLAENMGYSTFTDRSRFGLALVLGGGEVKLLEHVNAYSAFAREGILNSHVSILKVEDKNGNILEEYISNEKRVLTNQSARLINHILIDNQARASTFGLNSLLNISNREVAVKTGTTNNFRDAWAIGYTPSIVTGVWVGNSNNDEMARGAGGSTVAAPIWHDFMIYALKDHPKETFNKPENIITNKDILDGNIEITKSTYLINSITGFLADDNTPQELIEEVERYKHHSILHYVDKKDPLGPIPNNPEKDPQYNIWEKAIEKWAKEDEEFENFIIPKKRDELDLEDSNLEIEILSPSNNTNINSSDLIVSIKVTSDRNIVLTEYLLNNLVWQRENNLNEVLVADISFLNSGSHNLNIKVCNDLYNCVSDNISFNLINPNELMLIKPEVNILYPPNGASLNEVDFPLSISLDINNPVSISSINLYLNKKDDDNKKLLNNLIINQEKEIIYELINQPEPGEYQISGQIFSWLGENFIIPSINLIIN
jgi:1A family penicillin-binding protein